MMDTSLTEYPEHRYAIMLWNYFPPFFIVIGTFGNLITVTVLMQRKNRYSPTSIYLTTLALCDIVVLWTPLLTLWIMYTFDIDLTSLSSAQCKIFFFLSYYALQMSSSMIVAVTSERVISVLLPHKVRFKCRPRNALTVAITICACLFCLNIHWLFGVGVKTIDIYKLNATFQQSECQPLTEESKYFIEMVWPWIDLAIFYLIPLTILIAGSIAITVSLRINKHKRLNQVGPVITSTETFRNKMSNQLTKMLLTLDVVYFICTTPVTIYMTLFPDALSSPKQSRYLAVHELWFAIVNMLMFLNNTVNFILYFLSGSRFRNELKHLLCRRQTISIFPMTGSLSKSRAETDRNGTCSKDVNKCKQDTRNSHEPTAGTSIKQLANTG